MSRVGDYSRFLSNCRTDFLGHEYGRITIVTHVACNKTANHRSKKYSHVRIILAVHGHLSSLKVFLFMIQKILQFTPS